MDVFFRFCFQYRKCRNMAFREIQCKWQNNVFYYTERNGYRMPPNNRLDVSATLEGKKTKKFEGSWTFSAVQCIWAGKTLILFSSRMTRPIPQKTQAVQYSLFRWVPSVTYNFKF